MPGSLSIGALARRTRSKAETIRYYERVGLLPPPSRSAGGYRLYGIADVKRLNFIRRSRELGFALEEVRVLLRLVEGGDYTCAEVQALTLEHLHNVRSKLADLKRLEKTLARTVAQCAGGEVAACPVIDALFVPEGGVPR